MSFSEFLRKNLMHFFIIVTGITVATGVLGLSVDPGAKFGYEAYFSPIIFALIASLPSLALYSKKELTLRQMVLRRILHFILLVLLLMLFGYAAGILKDITTALYFAISVFLIYLFTNAVQYLMDSKMAVKINAGLKRLQSEED